jgi:hypothetical protein
LRSESHLVVRRNDDPPSPRLRRDKEDEAQRRRWTFYEAVKVANRKKLLMLLGLPRRDTAGRAVMKRHKPHQTPQKIPTGQHTRR